MSIFTKAFLLATLERAIRAGAASVLSLWAVGDGILNAIVVDWQTAGGVFTGGAAVSVLTSLVAGAVAPESGPSLGTEAPRGTVAAQATPDVAVGDTVAGPAAPGIPEGAPVDVVPDTTPGGPQ